ncbi:MAG: molybdopterin-dependent oxidoreductase [Dehalococcoidales bacterium]|nr:molybdopterin-dependent oxidoreductase [Dehalococcoidales bacterium]
MNEISLTINNRKVKGKAGDTVLEVCKANGIDVPTLCHLDGLSDIGACRLCVVEVEKERRPVPSCTYPIREGMVVRTDSEKLEIYRRQILELIFTEHNHFCMFCEASGDCELQNLAYRYQMDNVRYPYTFPALSVDAISNYLVIDHNRCILCGRCVRACSEVAASNTLSFSQRGWKTLVTADLEQPLGESSCRLCGACVQSCPTGAIFSKLSLYKGKREDCQEINTVCPLCGVGCELNVLVRDNNLVKIEAPVLNGARSALCRMGRFGLLEPTPPRISSPLIRGSHGELEECSLAEAAAAAAKIVTRSKGGLAGLISSRIPEETLFLFHRFMTEAVGSESLDTLDGELYRTVSAGIREFGGQTGLDIEPPINDLETADCIVVVGADPETTNPVVGTLIGRAVNQNGARLIVINPSRDVFPLRSDLWLKPEAGTEGSLLSSLAKVLIDKKLAAPQKASSKFRDSLQQCRIDDVVSATGVAREKLERAAEVYGSAKRAFIIYGEELLAAKDAGAVATILNLAAVTGNREQDRLRAISLKPAANSRGAWQLGLARGFKRDKAKVVYLLLGDEPESEALLGWLRGVSSLIVQASYYSPAVYMADVVLPSPTWAEREGKYTDMDGRSRELKRVLTPKEGLPQDEEVLIEISEKLGSQLS